MSVDDASIINVFIYKIPVIYLCWFTCAFSVLALVRLMYFSVHVHIHAARLTTCNNTLVISSFTHTMEISYQKVCLLVMFILCICPGGGLFVCILAHLYVILSYANMYL